MPAGARELVDGEMEYPPRHFGERAVAGRFAIRKIDRIEASKPDQQRMDRRGSRASRAIGAPPVETAAQGFGIGEAGQGVAAAVG